MKIQTLAFSLATLFTFAAQAASFDVKELSDRAGIEDTITALFVKTDAKDWAGHSSPAGEFSFQDRRRRG